MRIVFIGTVIFSEIMLERLIKLNAKIVGVLTKVESKTNSDFKDLSPVANANGIEHKYFVGINETENIHWINNLRPDVIFCFGLSQIIRKPILEAAPMGVVGYHPTLLPFNRGRHPIIWAIALGLRKTGSTFFFMDEGADSGDILSQEIIQIEEEMNSQQLYNKVIETSLQQVEKFLPELQGNTYVKKPQDHSKANYWRKRSMKDGIIDFRMDARKIKRLIAALSKPYIGAELIYNDLNIKIWESQVVKSNALNIEPGQVIQSKNGTIIVKCGTEAIKIIDHEFEYLPEKGEYIG